MARVGRYLGGLHEVLDVEQSVVDPEDDPVEQSAVQGLGHGVSHCAGLRGTHTDTHSAFVTRDVR